LFIFVVAQICKLRHVLNGQQTVRKQNQRFIKLLRMTMKRPSDTLLIDKGAPWNRCIAWWGPRFLQDVLTKI